MLDLAPDASDKKCAAVANFEFEVDSKITT
jgi:hypothetical protein